MDYYFDCSGMQVNPKRMTAMGRSVRAFVQNWLNRETDKSIVLVRWGDLLLVRFGVVSSIALLLGLIS
ncbi:MAG: hypothetical protein K8S54_20745, partial [Spirochaetia bacterium]|nr:hypothetical protein [Spirochaetia bacterium]